MAEYLIDYIKALMLKDMKRAKKLENELKKLGVDYMTLKILISDKELQTRAVNELNKEQNEKNEFYNISKI